MKRILFLSALFTASAFTQQQTEAPNPAYVLTRLSMNRLEAKLATTFSHPFPVAKLDIDARKRQPIALLALDLGKVAATRPFASIDDGSIEWMIGTEDIQQLGRISLDAYADMDESGEFIQVSLFASPDNWTAEQGTSNMRRGENETGKDFMDRVVLTYGLRTAKAADPQQALLLMSGFEKTLRAIHECRKEQASQK